MKISALLIFVLCVLAGSVSAQSQAKSVELTPQSGFGGRSAGNGTLKLLLGKPRSFRVESHGFDQRDNTFRLDQKVTFQGQPSRERFWIIKTVSQNRYAGTLSDAAGCVTGLTHGSRLRLKYRVKTLLTMHQTLELLPDGKTIDNVGKITFLGIPVGRLRETITRKD